MPSRGLYDDYVNMHSQRGFSQVRQSVRRRARRASNALCSPLHHIWTDEWGTVVEVTNGFCEFTGYEKNEMVGRSCGFLQGKDTNPNDILELRSAVRNRRQTSVVIVNYRKDGTPFWNILTIVPEFQNKKKKYSSEIIGLPVPPQMRAHPVLCLEDVLALISVFSSVPRGVSTENSKLKLEDLQDQKVDDANSINSSRPSTPSSVNSNDFYRHVNYKILLGVNDNNENDIDDDSDDTAEGLGYEFIAETSLPTDKGRFRVRAYRDPVTGAEPLALIVGNVEGQSEVVCRVHDQCVTSEVLGSLRCDCKQQLDMALRYIQDNGSGMVLSLPQEGRGIGLANKIAAYAVQETGLDTVDANRHLGLPDDARKYDSVKDILNDMNISSVKLLTNNPRKIRCLKDLGVEVTGRIPCTCVPNSEFSYNYVKAKAERMAHMINLKLLGSDR
mmetsp:Transcript_18220/g.22358  ORF Transcript_18220/g.22358 Transcript_18220/m.22358 type:complete len:444 (+) Transcript_18220:198-1529(+)